eukprot:TRINITY_DN20768_c0_g1_i1.p1 TRINITY_DN20768_c0_g1~~TRINITY_DN20768_c0_g1_i1.p1  ORF type:complete len:247 (+),score=51.29 TRINITY_DN20768_c0_g1_i1:171-911(+)
MAPPEDTPASSLPLASPSDSPIKNLLLVIAMQAEALPLVNKFQLTEDQNPPFPKGMPWIRYHGVYKDLQISIVIPGKDPIFVQALKPDVIINAGTAGGFKDKGACVGDVFLATDVAFHDRRIPIPVFDLYGKRSRPTFQPTNLVNDLGLKVGRLSTGDSLDLSPQDEEIIRANDTAIKDMEGAAVSYVAELFSIPAIFLKAVTDVVDGERPTAEEFLSNLNTVSQAMEEIVTKVIEYINGKTLSSL